MSQPPAHGEGEYYLEFVSVGGSVKVTAIDPATMREVSMVCPAYTTREQMGKLAVQKLQYVLNKEAQEDQPDDQTQ